MEQAEHDSGEDRFPCVVHRPNQQPWVVVMYATDWLILVLQALGRRPQAAGSSSEPENDTPTHSEYIAGPSKS
jgi:hypothetical protein